VDSDGSQYEITATVQGTADAPYEVDIECGMRGKAMLLHATCTCPVFENCKHIYAVLRHVAEGAISVPEPEDGPFRILPLPPAEPKLSDDWQKWLGRRLRA
jgi:uncharacterized Zn finger protein